MAKKVVDISKYFNNDTPEIVLLGKTYKVKSDKTTILLMNELQRKTQENIAKGSDDGTQLDEKILKLLLGDEAGTEIVEILNKSENYAENERAIMFHVMALATGEEYETLVERFRKQQG